MMLGESSSLTRVWKKSSFEHTSRAIMQSLLVFAKRTAVTTWVRTEKNRPEESRARLQFWWKITLKNYTRPHAGGLIHTFIFIHNPYCDDTQRNRILCNFSGFQPPSNHKKKRVTKSRCHPLPAGKKRESISLSAVLSRILTHRRNQIDWLWHNYWWSREKKKSKQQVNGVKISILLFSSSSFSADVFALLGCSVESLPEIHFGEWTFFSYHLNNNNL